MSWVSGNTCWLIVDGPTTLDECEIHATGKSGKKVWKPTDQYPGNVHRVTITSGPNKANEVTVVRHEWEDKSLGCDRTATDDAIQVIYPEADSAHDAALQKPEP